MDKVFELFEAKKNFIKSNYTGHHLIAHCIHATERFCCCTKINYSKLFENRQHLDLPPSNQQPIDRTKAPSYIICFFFDVFHLKTKICQSSITTFTGLV